MITIELSSPNDFDIWRTLARRAVALGLPPEDLAWRCPETPPSLFGTRFADIKTAVAERPLSVARRFVDAGRRVICHRDPERFARLYRLLWRLQDDRTLLSRITDDDIRWLDDRDKAVRRDIHKMHAFVRFRKLGERGGREAFASWFEPGHLVTELTAPFFVRRFHGMDWAILTPDARAVWRREQLSFGPGASRDEVPAEDAIEEQWKTYFGAIFNPARLKIAAMTAEMPKKYWRNLPEAEGIPALIRAAEQCMNSMQQGAVTVINPRAATWKEATTQAVDQPAESDSLTAARQQVDACRRCPLFSDATQAVFGEGPDDARLMIVGEQPGDQEDLLGRPFVGPAGQLLERALAGAEIDRAQTYLTNAVKHFKFEPRGKRRIHQRPNAGEIDHCRWWLDTERKLVRPDLIIALGATAIRGVLGRAATVRSLRGQLVPAADGTAVLVTVHPSYLLRLSDDVTRRREYDAFVLDLKRASARLAEGAR